MQIRRSLNRPAFWACLLCVLSLPLYLSGADRPRTDDGFLIPSNPQALVFPGAHGSHPEFRLEWWYLTGHLYTEDDRRFGFQATFFRRAREGGHDSVRRVASGAFGHGQIYLAHMALFDSKSGRHFGAERLNREGWDAGADEDGLLVWNGNWNLRMTDNAQRHMRLFGDIDGHASLSLELQPLKPKVLFGQDGISLKGNLPTSRSYYITFSRIHAEGTIVLGEDTLPVTGTAWMDHEISSGQLAPGQVGWDWTAIQLDDGREIMAFRLRRKDGSADPYSYLAWIDQEGSLTHALWGDWEWQADGYWKSPHSGASYPLDITVVTVDPASGEPVRLHLQPLDRDQELKGPLSGISYWEGACRVLDDSGREIGSAYVELTGYSEDMGGRL